MNETITAYQWPEITAAEAELGNRLYGISGRASLEVEGKSFRADLMPAFRAPYAPALRAVVGVGERRALLDLEAIPLPELLGYPEGGLSAGDLPAEVLRAYLEGVLGGLLEKTGRILGRPVSLVEAGAAEMDDTGMESGTARMLCFELREAGRAGAGEFLRGRLFLEPEEMSALADALPAPERGPGEWSALPVALRYCVGATRLSLAECDSLECGDIVMLGGDPLQQGGLRLCAGDMGRPLWTATWNEGTISIEEECVAEELDGAGSQGGDPGSLEALEVQVSFDLGGRMATLAEIKSLAAGSVFTLPENPDARVGIRVGGKAIGSGSLIMVDGRAGVRIESLWNGSPS